MAFHQQIPLLIDLYAFFIRPPLFLPVPDPVSYSHFLVAESLSRGSPPFEVGKFHRLIKVK